MEQWHNGKKKDNNGSPVHVYVVDALFMLLPSQLKPCVSGMVVLWDIVELVKSQLDREFLCTFKCCQVNTFFIISCTRSITGLCACVQVHCLSKEMIFMKWFFEMEECNLLRTKLSFVSQVTLQK